MSSDSMRPHLLLDCADIVGESIVWDERSKKLLWVDIVGQRIHSLEPRTMAHEVWPTPEFVTAIGLREDGGAIVGLTHRITLWDYGERFHTLAIPEPERYDNRLNEGCVAPDGSFWVGTMATNLTSTGAPKAQGAKAGRYYRVDTSGTVTRLSTDLYGIPNSMIWLGDGGFVTGDTNENALYRYTVAANGKSLCHRKSFSSEFHRGLPDGSCLDAENGIWTCRVAGGACLTRTRPDGVIVRIIELPCKNPTSCAFGGDQLDVLYITSARFAMPRESLENHPEEGGIFAFRPGVSGRRENRFQ